MQLLRGPDPAQSFRSNSFFNFTHPPRDFLSSTKSIILLQYEINSLFSAPLN